MIKTPVGMGGFLLRLPAKETTQTLPNVTLVGAIMYSNAGEDFNFFCSVQVEIANYPQMNKEESRRK
jgi:hypothetical protein